MAVSLVCERLVGGRITAVDRSPKMTEAAARRNEEHAGKVRFLTASVERADLGDEAYDKAFAVHVADLHEPGPALDAVLRRLVPGGRLYLFSQAPSWNEADQAAMFATNLGEALQEAGLHLDQSHVKELSSGFAAAVLARTPGG